MLDAIAGPAPGDPYAAPHQSGPFLDCVGAKPRKLRIALQRSPISGRPVHPDCLKAVDAAALLLQGLGHEVEEAQLPGSWDELGLAMWTLAATNVSLAVRRRVAELGRPLTPDVVDTTTWAAMQFAQTLKVEDYPAAIGAIHRQGRRMAEFHQRFDVILSPTLANPPLDLGVMYSDNPDVEAYTEAVLAFMPFTQVYNMTGQPSASVPLHWNEEGMPIGVMISAPYGGEATLFTLAGELEAASPWFDKVPEISL
jgi:Asp-tRNA(Asn)/Glu-tRNA(Gln) amidotransferase A subunit family amidase